MDSEKFKEFVALTETLPVIDSLTQRLGAQRALTDVEINGLAVAWKQMAIRRNILIAELDLPIEPLMIEPPVAIEAPATVEPVAAEAEGGGERSWP